MKRIRCATVDGAQPIVELDLVNENLAVGYDKEQGPKGIVYRNNVFQRVLRGGPAGDRYTVAILSNCRGGAEPVSQKIQNLVGRKG